MARLALLRLLAQQAFAIPDAIEYADYDNHRLFDRKGDGDAAAPADRPQAGSQTVAHCAATGKIRQLADMSDNAIGEALGDIRPRNSGDIVVNGIKMVTRFRREDDAMGDVQPHLAARLWRSAKPARTSSIEIPREGSA